MVKVTTQYFSHYSHCKIPKFGCSDATARSPLQIKYCLLNFIVRRFSLSLSKNVSLILMGKHNLCSKILTAHG